MTIFLTMLHGFAIQNQVDESLNILLFSKALAESDFRSKKLNFNFLVLNIYFLSWNGILWTLQIFNPSLLTYLRILNNSPSFPSFWMILCQNGGVSRVRPEYSVLWSRKKMDIWLTLLRKRTNGRWCKFLCNCHMQLPFMQHWHLLQH